jgi:hypothetical protein
MRYVNRFYNIIAISAEAVREDRPYPLFRCTVLDYLYPSKRNSADQKNYKKLPSFRAQMPEIQDLKERTIFIARV